MTVQTTLTLSALVFLPFASATPPSNGGHGGLQSGGSSDSWTNFLPSCVSSCRPASTDYKALCSDNTALQNLQTCVSNSDCDDAQKNDVSQGVAQWCLNAGQNLDGTPLQSWTASITSGATAWPSPTGAVGWHNSANGYGPFGAGHGPGGRGWGSGSNWPSTGDWTTGPWTAWWGGSAANGDCPGSDWPGWTSDVSLPWTTWTACTATTTASAVVTSTVTTSGSVGVVTGTSYGVKVALKTGKGSGSGSGNATSTPTPVSGAVGSAVTLGSTLAVAVGIVAVLLQ